MTLNVFSIPSGVPFLKVFAAGLVARHYRADSPHSFADVTVLLPTRRSILGLRDAFGEWMAAAGGETAAMILPRLYALGDVDEDELDLAAALSGIAAGAEDLPPVISPVRRRLYLARLIHPRLEAEAPGTPWSHALSWAESLAQLLDEALIEGADLARLDEAIPADLALHWEKSRDFLSVIAHAWPEVLAAEGVIDAADRRTRLLTAQEKAWAAHPPGPIYVAGSTGSQPATASLMLTVAGLPEGAVVLPGLDAECEDVPWAAIDPVHPQWSLKNWLERAEIDRRAVRAWPGAEAGTPDRLRLLSEVLRPAPTTDSWAGALKHIDLDKALSGLSIQRAEDQAEEARIISLLMRETLEEKGRTAALVTPDRKLARRVAAELLRWDVVVDDSAGLPLGETVPWLLLRHVAEAWEAGLAPFAFLALLKSPLVACGQPWGAHLTAASALERYCLRGPRPRPGFEGLRAQLKSVRKRMEARGSDTAALAPVEAFIARLEALFQPLVAAGGRQMVSTWAEAHIAVAEALAATDAEAGADRLWRGSAGEAASALMAEIADEGQLGPVSFADYAEIFERLAAGRAVRPQRGQHPRLSIWGPLEARLQSADLMILGGLTEETWPQRPSTGPWVNTLMRAHIGLSDPERRIGLSAHDFQDLASAPRVVLTLPEKVDRQPALPSRWVLRLENFLKGRGAEARVTAALPHRAFAARLDAPDTPYPRDAAPSPRPPVALRPRRLRITEIETYLRDPYSIFAKHVLKLSPLDPVDEARGPRQVGTLVHEIMEAFVKALPDAVPDDAHGTLLSIAVEKIRMETDDPYERRVWLARMERAAEALVAWERARRLRFRPAALEVRGEMSFDAPAGPLVVHGRADRIDRDIAGGGLSLIDYKTGQMPTKPQMKRGLKPQLIVEALMAEAGGFDGLDKARVEQLLYIQIGSKAGLNFVDVTDETAEFMETGAAALAELFAAFDNPDTPYLSWPMAEKERQTGDYDLLARAPAWRFSEGEGE